MAVLARVRENVAPSNPGGGGGVSGYYAPLYVVNGLAGSPVLGSNTYTNVDLVGAEELTYIIVNSVIEYLNTDFTFNPETGTIVRSNPYQTGDKIIVPHRSTAPNAYYAPLWIAGNVGHPEVDSFSFTHASLIGASELTFIIVNSVYEYVDTDFTFDPALGVITRTNPFVAGDKMITPHVK